MFGRLFKKRESLLSLDIGGSMIKLLELNTSGVVPVLVNIGIAPTPAECIQGNAVIRPELLADAITALLEENGISDKRVALAMPSPSVFTKRIKMPQMSAEELADNIQLEAGSFIPHNINAVKLDYHVLGESGKQLDVLVVAVKEEIVDGFLEAVAMSGLETAVIDVDYFALQNAFESAYGDLIDKTVALINIGFRYSSINICRGGGSLFTGDVSIGGKLFTDALMEQLSVSQEEAEQLKRAHSGSDEKSQQAREVIEKNVEYAASEFNRQLSFFWSASGAEEGIDKIFLSGGAGQVAGLLEEISEKTGISSEQMNPFKAVEIPAGFDKNYVRDLGPLMAVSLGLALRQPGDKIVPEFME